LEIHKHFNPTALLAWSTTLNPGLFSAIFAILASFRRTHVPCTLEQRLESRDIRTESRFGCDRRGVTDPLRRA
jgi:hypothetical protein